MEDYKKIVLTKGFAIAKMNHNCPQSWFPNIRFFDHNGQFVTRIYAKEASDFYRSLKETFLDDKRDVSDRVIGTFIFLADDRYNRLTLSVICGFFYLFPEGTEGIDRVTNSFVTIDSAAAKRLVSAIESI